MARRKATTTLLLTLVAAVGLPALVFAAPYVVMKNGQRVVGEKIRAKPNGDILLTTKAGSQRTFPASSIQGAFADKPPTFDKADQQLKAKQYDTAITTLQGIVREYRYLGWDVKSMPLLAKAQLAKGDTRAAIATYEKLFRQSAAAKKGAARWGYYDAVLAAKDYGKLERELGQLISSGERGDAAKAQIVRGDIKAARGDVQGAAMDYLRTVILFKAEREHQPEALYKAGQALDKLRDERARKMYATLDQKYGDSPWARRPRGK